MTVERGHECMGASEGQTATFRQVVAAITGTEEAATVLPWSARLARTLGVPVRLAMVLDPARLRTSEVVAMAMAQDLLDLYAASTMFSGIDVTTQVVEGLREEELPRLAEAMADTLLVMTAGEQGTMSRSLLGDETTSVVHALHTPVLVLPARVTPPEQISTAIVGIDWTPLAATVEKTAQALAGALRIGLIGVEVIEPGTLSQPEFVAMEPLFGDGRVVLRGQAAPSLLAVAQVREAGLIIVGTHGASGPLRRSLGGTAIWLARHADRPVVIVPAAAKAGTGNE